MTDCIVVGGGLIGMLTARELRRAGAEVVLLEKAALGGESTWAGGGILSPLYPWRYPDAVNALARLSQNMYAQIARQLQQESGIDPEYTRSGLLFLEQPLDAQVSSWQQHWNMSMQVLEAEELSSSEPELNTHFNQGLLLPEIAQLRNPRLAKALKGSLQHYSIPCYENTEVTGLVIKNDRIQGVNTQQQDFIADKVVIAGGAWSADIIKQYTQAPAIAPVKGQMILFRGPANMLKHILLHEDRYVIPRRDGRILVGSTIERTGFDKQTTDAALQELKRAAIDLLPALHTLPIEHHWAGLRPGTASGIPYICEHPRVAGLYINSGHYRNGVVLGAASCSLLADMVLQRPLSLDAQAYSLEADH